MWRYPRLDDNLLCGMSNHKTLSPSLVFSFRNLRSGNHSPRDKMSTTFLYHLMRGRHSHWGWVFIC